MFSKIERGDRRANREQVIKLAEYLHQDEKSLSNSRYTPNLSPSSWQMAYWANNHFGIYWLADSSKVYGYGWGELANWKRGMGACCQSDLQLGLVDEKIFWLNMQGIWKFLCIFVVCICQDFPLFRFYFGESLSFFKVKGYESDDNTQDALCGTFCQEWQDGQWGRVTGKRHRQRRNPRCYQVSLFALSEKPYPCFRRQLTWK